MKISQNLVAFSEYMKLKEKSSTKRLVQCTFSELCFDFSLSFALETRVQKEYVGSLVWDPSCWTIKETEQQKSYLFSTIILSFNCFLLHTYNKKNAKNEPFLSKIQ